MGGRKGGWGKGRKVEKGEGGKKGKVEMGKGEEKRKGRKGKWEERGWGRKGRWEKGRKAERGEGGRKGKWEERGRRFLTWAGHHEAAGWWPGGGEGEGLFPQDTGSHPLYKGRKRPHLGGASWSRGVVAWWW
jgi:hypothetical protein